MKKETVNQELKVLVTNGSAIVSAYLFKWAIEKMLETLFKKEPPKKPDKQENIGWIEAIGWAAFTGALAGALKLVISRGTKIQLDKAI